MIRNEVDGTSVCLHHFPSKQSISSEKASFHLGIFSLASCKITDSSPCNQERMRRDSQRVKSLPFCGRAKQRECSLPHKTVPPPQKTTTVFLFQLSEASWCFLLIPPWDDIPVWINGFIRGVIELKTLQMLDSGEHPADTWTLTQLYLRRLPVVPGCCDSHAVYVSLSLLSFIFKRSVSSLRNVKGTVSVCKWASASSVLENLE